MLPEQQAYEAGVTDEQAPFRDPVSYWSRRAARAYQDSTDYFESSLFDEWRSNVAHANSQHATGSKYHTDAYRQRSKLFRPKTKSALRASSAAVAASLFSNNDVLAIDPVDPDSRENAAAAKLLKHLTQHRLEHDIPWYLTVLGAHYDTSVYGCCFTKTYWQYDAQQGDPQVVPLMDEYGNVVIDQDGNPVGEEIPGQTVIREDRPVIDLVAPENMRFDPNADWRDPIHDSPYVIELMPMFAIDVLEMMRGGNPGEQIPWMDYTLDEILAYGSMDTEQHNTVRAERNRGREEPAEMDQATKEYRLVWPMFHIHRDVSGQDVAFYTIGQQRLLSMPMPLENFFIQGRDVYTMGIDQIETHKVVPTSRTGLFAPIQVELNDLTNQRHDNVRLVLNKRYALRRGASIDVNALMRNVPGGGVLMDDPHKDYKLIETPDVTSSSYAEQDRLNVEGDELMGHFSQSSVQTNRNLNETVGGMNQMSNSASLVTELDIRTFVETWAEPVLRTLVKLIQEYETDERIIAIAARKADILEQIPDELFLQDLVVKINVGIGNTNPAQRIERLMTPINTMGNIPEFAARIDWDEVGKELFAIVGHGDGERFMLTPEKLEERAAQQQQGDPMAEAKMAEMQARLQIAQLEAQTRMEIASMESQVRMQTELAKLAAQQETTVEQIRTQLGIAQLNDKTKREVEALKAQNERTKQIMQATNLQAGYDTF